MFISLMVVALTLSACASFSGRQNPIDLKKTEHACPADKKLDDYQSLSAGSAAEEAIKKDQRNRLIDDCIDAADEDYQEFSAALREQATSLNLGVDITAIGLSTGAALASKSAAHTLSSLSSAVTGAGAVVNKDLYYSTTLPALLSAMDANRKQILVGIKQAEQNPTSQYSLSSARHDIRDYVSAGSIDNAISQITTTATDTGRTAQALLDELRTGTYSTSDTTKRLIAWLYPDGKTVDASGNRTKPIQGNVDKLNEWMKKDTTDKSLADITWPTLVFNTDSDSHLENDRARAIEALKIPKAP